MKILVILLLLCSPVFAANHFVRSAASGTASGADWTNAFTDLPASLVRGDVYYVSSGNYAHHTFNDADSASLVIEVRAATVADHGTSTGWSDSFQGTATFAPTGSGTNQGCVFEFLKDFYLINGNGVANTYFQGGQLIKVDDSNLNAAECGLILGAGSGGTVGAGTWVHDITISYIEYNGSHATVDTGVHEQGIESRCGNGSVIIQNSYIHDVGSVNIFVKGKHDSLASAGSSLCNANSTGSQLIIQYNYIARDYSSAARHGEAIECDEGAYCTIRYNWFRDITGTAFIATPSGCGRTTCNIDNQWDVYGNIAEQKNTFSLNGVQCGVGGFIQMFDTVFSGPVKIYNNTIFNVNTSICSNNAGGANIFIQTTAPTADLNAGLFVQNNLWYNNDNFTAQNTCSSCSAVTWSFNAYFTQSATDTDGNKQVSATNPFVNVSVDNVHLASDTNAWSSLASPFNTDPDNVTRTSSRGAFQFISGGVTGGSGLTGNTTISGNAKAQ